MHKSVYKLSNHIVQARTQSTAGHDTRTHLTGVKVSERSRARAYKCLCHTHRVGLSNDVIDHKIFAADDLVVPWSAVILNVFAGKFIS